MAADSSTLALAQSLIARASVTPVDAGCQALLADRLGAVGFSARHLRFGDVDNVWLRRGNADPLLCFVGHTDVVPPGPLEQWTSDPFTPQIRDGYLYGRGAADMKGSIAAFTTACERFVATTAGHQGSIALLITSDEEGPSVNGTVKVIEHLTERAERIRWCLVGEPSSRNVLGDTIKNGRRGSLNATLTVRGKQGHVAYPQDAINPIHSVLPALSELAKTTWDRGSEHFPPTTFQLSNINSGTGADNVVPGELEAKFNFRYSTALTREEIERRTLDVLDSTDMDYDIAWRHSGGPFLTPTGKLVDAARAAVRNHMGHEAELSTSGGTSDGRFVAPTGAEVLELGPVNATIHQLNECVSLKDLDVLSNIYEDMIRSLLT